METHRSQGSRTRRRTYARAWRVCSLKTNVACSFLTERTTTQLVPGSGIIHATHAAHVAARRMLVHRTGCLRSHRAETLAWKERYADWTQVGLPLNPRAESYNIRRVSLGDAPVWSAFNKAVASERLFVALDARFVSRVLCLFPCFPCLVLGARLENRRRNCSVFRQSLLPFGQDPNIRISISTRSGRLALRPG